MEVLVELYYRQDRNIIFYKNGLYRGSDQKYGNCSFWKIENGVLYYKHSSVERWHCWRDAEHDMGLRLENAIMNKFAEIEFEKEILKS